jgi:DMSO/TMAO reductase YedYZ molybdopterin-dependent catalytic subunit
VDVVFAGLDHGVEGEVEQRYERSLTLAEALESHAVLAYEMNGVPLPPQHGFPLRLVVPGWYGMTNVKWLTAITVATEPFAGYQVASGYRFRQTEAEEGRPVTRMRPRSLMVPPGMPEFATRERILDAGRVLLEGRAWSGRAPIARVEVSVDGGSTWADAELTRDLDGPWAWCGWTFAWNAAAGSHVLCCRATDEAGDAQPLEPEWNLGGYENNAVQRVPVVVR